MVGEGCCDAEAIERGELHCAEGSNCAVSHRLTTGHTVFVWTVSVVAC